MVGLVQHGKCGKSFGANRSHCGGCCRTFIALSHFDAHRIRQGKHEWTCNPLPATLGFELRNEVWGPPASHDNLAATATRLAQARAVTSVNPVVRPSV